ncbi:MAG: VWA domain-containing protein, partial [Clostridia bacterium]|nr:VWA domain-containing protein [Clostridia bacterium]
LNKDGEKYAEKTVYLSYGKNTASFELPTDEAGTFDYELSISCDEDENLYNNKLAFSQTVSDEVSVLLITNKDEDYLALRQIYGENANIDAYYGYMSDIPCSVEEICRYDEIVLSDVDVYTLKNRDLFLHSLETAVSLFGKTLLTFGDMYVESYPAGELKQLSSMLPVNYGASSDAPKLYTILLDTSSSMEYFPGNFDRAKRAASEIINMASENTMIGLVTFDGNAEYYAATTDKDKLLDDIDSLTVKQSTDLQLGLRQTFNVMRGGDYSEKRVMLITDGVFTDDGVIDLVTQMRDNGIYTGVLDVGRGNIIDTGFAALLQQIARVGSATADDPDGIFLDISSETNLGDALKELPKYDTSGAGGLSFISVKRFNDDVLGGISDAEITGSFVNGYLYSEAKSNATTVLTVKYNPADKPMVSEDAPLYSYWNYGNGRTASFTSSLSGQGIANFNPEVRNKLFYNILSVNLPSEKTDYPFLLDVEAAEGYATVTLTPETVRADAVTNIEITAPDGTVTNGSLAFGTSSFSYNLVTPAEGKYIINITYEAFGQTFNATRIINVSYSSEYDSFTLYDASVLHKAIGANGKVSEDGKLVIVNDESEIGLYNLSLSTPLLIVCVVLYAVDIAVRKLKWEDIKSFFKRSKKVK